MKVKYLPLQPHCFAFGGFDIQMILTSNAIANCGVEIEKMDIWDRNRDFAILHCWGLNLSHTENYNWAKKAGKKLVASILVRENETLHDKFRFKISSLLYKQRMVGNLLKMPDKIVVVNDYQANFCNVKYKVPSQKIDIIPNVVGDEYFMNAEMPASNKYILIVGNVCARKNQVKLAEACIAGNYPLVIIGKVLDGEKTYGDELNKLVNNNSNLITWIEELKEGSNELITYYKNCMLFALPSFVEQQPLSMLEAAVIQKPILTADRNYAKQRYYQNALKINPTSVLSIKEGISTILKAPSNYVADQNILVECKSDHVGNKYKELYEKLMC